MREQVGNGTGTTTTAATTTMTTMRDAGGETDGTRTIVDAFAYVAIDAVECAGFDVTRLSNEGEATDIDGIRRSRRSTTTGGERRGMAMMETSRRGGGDNNDHDDGGGRTTARARTS